ncbi:MAG: PEP/pyruvate-binding domain-containing protein, partial [Gammaproteobacteria bacterium]|nr:PEP/pyruvate-binding domain-containing protein [Gammaproteobacteria bacterium]
VDTDTPRLFFINSKNGTEGTYHYDFARDVLKQYTDLNYRDGQALFSSQSYFTSQRRFLLGSVISYDRQSDQQSEQSEIYSIEFWPTDPVSFKLVNLAYQTIERVLPIAKQRLYYHPVGDTQQQLYSNDKQRYDASLKTIFTEDLLAGATHSVLNEGEAYGRLRVIEPGDPPASRTDIAIYRFIPNDLTHIAGIITEAPQTPLSHINLKARQNNTPNSYLINASSNDTISPLIGEWVHYQAIGNHIDINAASQQEAEDWFKSIRPAQTQIPGSDLSVTTPQRLTDIGFSDWISFGVKAANVAELAKILPDGMVPDGYAIPFALYNEFMGLPRCGQDQTKLCTNSESGLSFYQQAEQMLASPEFQNDTELREQQLKAFRKAIRNAQAPQAMTATIEAIRLFWEPQGEPFTQSLRVRSSTNNEDLPGFNGAGLYSSYTHKKDEGKLIESIKQVWASLWNARAFDERDFHRVDHFKTYMGVLVHPNFGDEQANGVAVSKNIYNPNWQGIYCNVQYGEISITNPEPIVTEAGEIAAIPDEFIISRLPVSDIEYDWETQFIRYSNVEEVYGNPVPAGNVLRESEMIQLRDAMLTVHNHFKQLYQGNESFAMETEFKITETDDGSRGKLAIKQARPWID